MWSGLSCIICEITIEDDYPYCMGLYPSDQDLYGCTECKTVICVECAIGKYPYLKPGITINKRVLRLRLHPIAVFLGRYILHVTTSAETNWFSSIREMLSFSVLSSVLYLHLKPYLPRQADSQESSLFLYYYAWEKSGNVDKSPSALCMYKNVYYFLSFSWVHPLR